MEKNGKVLTVYAIVDSGADSCIFPSSFASALDISVPNQNAFAFSGTSKQPQIAYFETIKVTVMDIVDPAQNISFDLYAGFCDSLEHVGMGLLGQEVFFSRFEVSFYQPQSYFEIK